MFLSDADALPKRLHRFVVQVGNGTEDNKNEGDWMFKTGVHKKISLGVSYIYDDTEFTSQIASTINPLQASTFDLDGGLWHQPNIHDTFTIFDESLSFDNIGLNLSLALHVGDLNSVPPDGALSEVGMFPTDKVFNISAAEL